MPACSLLYNCHWGRVLTFVALLVLRQFRQLPPAFILFCLFHGRSHTSISVFSFRSDFSPSSFHLLGQTNSEYIQNICHRHFWTTCSQTNCRPQLLSNIFFQDSISFDKQSRCSRLLFTLPWWQLFCAALALELPPQVPHLSSPLQLLSQMNLLARPTLLLSHSKVASPTAPSLVSQTLVVKAYPSLSASQASLTPLNKEVHSVRFLCCNIELWLTCLAVYHIHQFQVPADGNCTGTGGHLDPTNRGEVNTYFASLTSLRLANLLLLIRHLLVTRVNLQPAKSEISLASMARSTRIHSMPPTSTSLSPRTRHPLLSLATSPSPSILPT